MVNCSRRNSTFNIQHSRFNIPVSDGKSQNAYRCHVRPPSFVNLQALPAMARGHLVSDLVALIGTIDIVLGEVDR